MPAKVVDASVLAALVFNEPRADEAEHMLAGNALYAPDLLPYEMSSIARKKTLRYPGKSEAIAAALELCHALEISLLAVHPCAMLELAIETGLTTYDASYLYLARELSCPLVTFDNRLTAQSIKIRPR